MTKTNTPAEPDSPKDKHPIDDVEIEEAALVIPKGAPPNTLQKSLPTVIDVLESYKDAQKG